MLGSIRAQAEVVGKVDGVIDGDSIRVMHEGQAEQIRLIRIDCPEKRQLFFRDSPSCEGKGGLAW